MDFHDLSAGDVHRTLCPSERPECAHQIQPSEHPQSASPEGPKQAGMGAGKRRPCKRLRRLRGIEMEGLALSDQKNGRPTGRDGDGMGERFLAPFRLGTSLQRLQ